MIKFILCIGAVGLCVLLAWLLTRKYRMRMQFYYNLNLFNERLVNEVSYTRIPLPAFMEKYTFGGDFRHMLEIKRDARFDNGDEGCDIAYLSEDERKFLGDYFRMIGKSDAASQRTYLSAMREEIADKKQKAEEIYRKYFSLYIKLGFLAGLILVVLIV